MARVSEQPLTDAEQRALLQQCTKLLADKSSFQQQQLLQNLLTPTECVIVIKRVAAVILIDQHYSLYEVARSLKLSTATVSDYKKQVDDGKFKTLLEIVRGKEFDSEKFWQSIDKILRLGLPPMAGPGRWGTLASVRGTRSRRK